MDCTNEYSITTNKCTVMLFNYRVSSISIVDQFRMINYTVYIPSVCLNGGLLHASSILTPLCTMIHFTTIFYLYILNLCL